MQRHPRRHGRPDAPAARVEIVLLGGFEVVVDGATVPDRHWTRRAAASLIKILALAPGHALHREQVIDMLWPDDSPRDVAPKLHKAAHFARRATGCPDAVVLHNDTVRLFPSSQLRVDVPVFEELARRAITDRDSAAAREAVAAYGGELLPADRYEEWTVDRRELLRLRYLDVLGQAGRWVEVSELEPSDERARVSLMQHFVGVGDTSAALRQYDHLERVLGAEHGVTPGRSARDLRDRIETIVESTRDTGRFDVSTWTDAATAADGDAVATVVNELVELVRAQAALLERLVAAGAPVPCEAIGGPG